MSFVVYDTETTGINTSFDQILQFGAVRTDDTLREIERFEVRSRLLNHIVPAPGAIRTTGVTPDKLSDLTLPSHYEMMRAIKAKFADWSPTLFLGHNSIRFDEEMLRQAFYQTLHRPYVTNMNGNGRLDSLLIIRAIEHFHPGVLTIPLKEDGKKSFRLDQLAPANGFDHVAAHDAMGDVEATLYLCRLLAEQSPNLWNHFVYLARKSNVLDFIAQHSIFAMAGFVSGQTRSWMVTQIGTNPKNGSEAIVYDLAHDPGDLVGLTDESLEEHAAMTPHLLQRLRTNAGPCLISYDDTPEVIRSALPDKIKLERRANVFGAHPELAKKLSDIFCRSLKVWEPSPYLEKQIYDGFAGPEDEALSNRFQVIDWADRRALVAQFEDERLRKLGERLIYQEAPDVMPSHLRARYDKAIARRLMLEDDAAPWLTLPNALSETDKLLTDASEKDAVLLTEYRHYLLDRIEAARRILSQ